MKERIYVCHTFYHVYVAILKEFRYLEGCKGKATIVLSKMSVDFEDLDERLKISGLFEQVSLYVGIPL